MIGNGLRWRILTHRCAASDASTIQPRSVCTRTTWLPGVCPPTACSVTPGSTSTVPLCKRMRPSNSGGSADITSSTS
ncbi:hypothetical protein D3C76_1768380 [compost metagenome]